VSAEGSNPLEELVQAVLERGVTVTPIAQWNHIGPVGWLVQVSPADEAEGEVNDDRPEGRIGRYW
jgi:hypothetical protein